MAYYLGMIDLCRNTAHPSIIQGIFKSDSENTNKIIKIQDKFLKIAFITVFSSIIENFFGCIYKSLFLKKIPTSIYHVRKELFKELQLSYLSDEWLAYSILSNIRNTVHNNGIYTEESKEILYRGRNHLFIKDKPQDSADLETIVFIQQDLFRMTMTILNHPKIISIKDIIDPSSLF